MQSLAAIIQGVQGGNASFSAEQLYALQAAIAAQRSSPPNPLLVFGDTNVPDPAKAINTDSQGEKENSQPPSAAPPPTANNSAEGVEHLTELDSSCPTEPEKTVEPKPAPIISPEAEWNSLDDDDGTPPEKPSAEVQKSDSNKGKAAKASGKDKAVNFGVPAGSGSFTRVLEKKEKFFHSIHMFNEINKKWPNQVQMVGLAKERGIIIQYSTGIDQIRIATSSANDRIKKRNDMNNSLSEIEDKASQAYADRLAESKKLDKEIAKYKSLDLAALAVTDAKCGKTAAEADKVREAATESKKQAAALRDKVTEALRLEQMEVVAKNKRLAVQKEEQAKAAAALAQKQAETLDNISKSLPSAKRARQDASINQLLMVIVAGSKRKKFSEKVQAIYDKLEEKMIEKCVIDLADSDDEVENVNKSAESIGEAS
ncbi:hypothetical protein CYMTET_50964 [Cymbomonas tetramitiformis]|uniref:Uncharacterized protein n=1 Tax=Cymbomonas tetramitiformis TaxID=36881 RepID=A0AAE0EU82_9CHLO|nr:hypothetical protein CYMTET_50964 [Cymbomonas tetramitiformis]